MESNHTPQSPLAFAVGGRFADGGVAARRVLEDYGFEYRQTVGSHYTFSYILSKQTKLLVVPFRRPVKSAYVKRAIKLIDQMIGEQGEDESEESDEQEP